MGLLSKAKEQVEKAKSGVGDIKNRLGRVTKDQQELQDEMNYYKNLEEQVEEDVASQPDAAEREARELEKADREIAEKVKQLDSEIYQILQEEAQDMELLAQAFKKREQFEASTKETIRNIAEDHGDFDRHLEEAIDNLENYISKDKDGQGSLYRGNVGRHAQSEAGKNWQNLARTANSIRKELRGIVERESEMIRLMQQEERTLEEFREEWEESLKDIRKVKKDIQFYYGREEELKGIAEKLNDSELVQEVTQREWGTARVRDLTSKLDEMVDQINSIISNLEEEEELVLQHQSDAEEKAETIEQMSASALEQVERIKAIVEGDKYPDLSINSKEKWLKEINAIEKAMKEVQELVEKFEEIEEKEIQIEREEEEMLEAEYEEGQAAAGDD